MGLFSEWFGAEAGIKATADLVEKTGGALDRLFTSDEERLSRAEVLERLKQRPSEFAQQLNLIGAAGNWFNSGWRPALGWVGALSLLLFYVPQYVMAAVVWVSAVYQYLDAIKAGEAIVLPAYPVTANGIMELIGLLLGGAVLRSYEKRQGIAK